MIALWITTLEARAFFGVLATVLSLIAYAPYIFNTLRGETRPHRACWLIWSVLATISFFSQLAEGATTSLGFSAAQAGATVLIFLLSVVRGQGQFMTRTDAKVLAVAALGLALWYVTDTPVYALIISITISLMGGMLTVHKTYWFPDSETMLTWVLSFCSAIAAAVSVGSLHWVLLAYPAYLLTLNGAIIVAWLLAQTPRARRRREQLAVFRSVRSRYPL